MKSLFDQNHVIFAKQNAREYYAIFKSLLSSNHWLVSSPDVRNKLVEMLSMDGQVEMWREELSRKRKALHPEPMDPSEYSATDFYLLVDAHDATYAYSDSLSVWRAGEETASLIKQILKVHPEYLEYTRMGRLGIEMKEQVMTSQEAQALFVPDLLNGEPLSRHLMEVSLNLPGEEELKLYLDTANKLKEIDDHVRPWNNEYSLPFFTKSTPHKCKVLATPLSFPNRLEEIGNILTSLMMESNSHGLLRYFFSSRYTDYSVINIRPLSRDEEETVVIITFGRVNFYHDTKLRVNKIHTSKYANALRKKRKYVPAKYAKGNT